MSKHIYAKNVGVFRYTYLLLYSLEFVLIAEYLNRFFYLSILLEYF